jgi:cytochrome c553
LTGRRPTWLRAIVAAAAHLVLPSVVPITTSGVCDASSPTSPDKAPTFVGSATCGTCHQREMTRVQNLAKVDPAPS